MKRELEDLGDEVSNAILREEGVSSIHDLMNGHTVPPEAETIPGDPSLLRTDSHDGGREPIDLDSDVEVDVATFQSENADKSSEALSPTASHAPTDYYVGDVSWNQLQYILLC